MEINLEKINAMMNDVRVGGERLATLYPYHSDGTPHPTMVELRQEVYLLLWEGLVRGGMENIYDKKIIGFTTLRAMDMLRKLEAPVTIPIHSRGASKTNKEKIKQARYGVDVDDIIDIIDDPSTSPEAITEHNENFSNIISMLTEEEKAILQMMLEGYTQKEIAEEYDYSYRTIKRRCKSIKEKIL
jgi:RNA polymerase sigma factor (sigma-70 family)